MKQTLACSLHEVARILNGNEAENVDEIKGIFSGVSIGDYPQDDKGNIIFAGGVAVVEGELIPIFESMLQVSGLSCYLVDFSLLNFIFSFYAFVVFCDMGSDDLILYL